MIFSLLSRISATVLLLGGVALFFPSDLLLPPLVPGFPPAAAWLGQLLGAAWLGVAVLDRRQRAAVLGGIYYSTTHLFIIGLTFAAGISTAQGEPAPRVRQLPEAAKIVRDTQGNPRTSAIYAPEPIYPWKARLQRLEGKGLFALLVRSNGTVSGVAVIRSTGSKLLDVAAAQTLIQWRFPPRAGLESVKIPINFSMRTRLKGGGTIHGP